jgi:Right handed beta helix region
MHAVAATLFALGLTVVPAHAQLARTFVSSFGDDANDCGRLTPCRTFQVAHDKTLAKGEITVLDAGGYGAVTITKAVSIINDGVGEAGVLVSGGLNGITIAAGGSDAVSLRGLTVKGIGFGGGNGIVFNSGKSLTIENCALRNLTGASPIGFGIMFQPSAAASLAVSRTLVADNERDGIRVLPSGAAAVKAVFSRVELYNNGGVGVVAIGSLGTGAIDATVADSIAAGNDTGFVVNSTSAATSLMLIRSVSANNRLGVATSGTAIARMRIGESTITGNAFSWGAFTGSLLRSYGNNNINGNDDGDPAIPLIAEQ